MRVQGIVKDAKTGLPLQGASIFAADMDQKPLGPGVLTDKDGKFSMSTSLFDDPTVLLGVSFVGYDDQSLIPTDGQQYLFKLEPEKTGMAAVYVTAKKKVQQVIKETPAWAYFAIGGALVLGYFMPKIITKLKTAG